MSNTSPQSSASSVDAIYTQLQQQDIEQFYAGYQLWNLQQQIAALQCEIGALQQQITENGKCLQEVQPSAIALATLARLQANGVSDLELLDRLLEQGEIWLDRMMQRLDYCEQLDDFILDDYTQWCAHALEGAYDWIDSIQESRPAEPLPVAAEETLTGATEELFLQKLTRNEDEDKASMLETTVKRPAITVALAEEAALLEQPVAIEQEAAPMLEEQAPISEESYVGEEVGPAIEEYMPVAEEPVPEEELFIYTDEQLDILEYLVPEETLPTEETSTSEGEPDQHPQVYEVAEATPASEELEIPSLESPSQSEEPEPVVSATFSSDVEKHEEAVQASSPEEGGQHQQSTTTKRRSNLFERLIRNIWGS